MSSTVSSEPAAYFKLTYSKIILGIEIGLHGLLLLCITQVITDAWKILFLVLFTLLSIRFFQSQSIITQFNQAAIEIRSQLNKLIWYDHQGSQDYQLDEIKLVTSRWFILLQLGKGKDKINRLVLADSFVDKSHYTRFRRYINEMNAC